MPNTLTAAAYDRDMIRAVVVDLGEVLACPPSLLPALADSASSTDFGKGKTRLSFFDPV